jgi:hypothetical protein
MFFFVAGNAVSRVGGFSPVGAERNKSASDLCSEAVRRFDGLEKQTPIPAHNASSNKKKHLLGRSPSMLLLSTMFVNASRLHEVRRRGGA